MGSLYGRILVDSKSDTPLGDTVNLRIDPTNNHLYAKFSDGIEIDLTSMLGLSATNEVPIEGNVSLRVDPDNHHLYAKTSDGEEYDLTGESGTPVNIQAISDTIAGAIKTYSNASARADVSMVASIPAGGWNYFWSDLYVNANSIINSSGFGSLLSPFFGNPNRLVLKISFDLTINAIFNGIGVGYGDTAFNIQGPSVSAGGSADGQHTEVTYRTGGAGTYIGGENVQLYYKKVEFANPISLPQIGSTGRISLNSTVGANMEITLLSMILQNVIVTYRQLLGFTQAYTIIYGSEGSPMNYPLTGVGGSGAGYTYSVVSGALPVGISFSTSGVFTGTTLFIGSYALTIRITDSLGATRDLLVTLQIYDNPYN